MNAFLYACIAVVNDIGHGFCTHAAGMFVQSGVLIVVLLSADLLLRRYIRATLRYWIWMLVIIKLLLPPTFSLPTGVGHWLGGCVALPAPVARQVLEVAGSQETVEQPMPPDMAGQPLAPPVQRSNARGAATGAEPVEPITSPGERLTWQGGAVLLWGVGVLGFAGLVMRRVFFVRRLMARGGPAKGDAVDLLNECCRRMNIHRQVRMKLLPGAFSPAVCGLWRPTILLPRTLPVRLSPDNLRAVLIHELAHVKRADLWVNCVQTILQVIYFYNPLVWLANAIVRRVREQAVDEMALVALGAEARSYGNTLIDIAEMAFWRATPALGLVGVAESKKSLEGRIRHMITRPIPKNAKVGATGALVIAVVGALVLPMATARTDGEKAQFIAHLSGGATVELVGVCNWPTPEPTCWQPDGSKLEPPLRVTKWNQRPGPNSYGFILKTTGPEDLQRTWRKIEGATGWEASCDVVNGQGTRLENYTAAIATFEKTRPETTVEVGLATGPWHTIATDDNRDQMQVDHSGVLWSQAFETSGGTSIVASTAWDKTVDHRVVAIDTKGAVHTTREGGSVASRGVEQFTAHFPGLRRDQIRQFQYQVRPFAWAVFEGISLQPGVKTSLQVQTSSQPTVVRSPGAEDTPTGTVPSSTGKGHDSLPNIFIFSPSHPVFDVFGQVIAQAGEWTWNKTGRDHARKSYDEIFDGTDKRTDHDVLVLLFALDREDRIPAEYEDLLPQPWAQIQEQLQRGETVELSGKARDLNVVLLAAPRMEQLEQAIADSHALHHPQDLLGSRGQGCDVAIENSRIVAVPERGTYEAHVSIRNRGRVASPQFDVSFYLGDPRTTKPLLHGAGPIQPGDVWNESSGSFGLKEGINQVCIALDPANLVDELDESNNQVLLTVEMHDGQMVKQATAPAAVRGKASRTLSTGEVRPAESAESAQVDIAIGNTDLRVTKLSDRLVEATILLRNNSSVPLPQFRVNFYAGDPDKGGRLLSPQQAGPIMPGNTWAEYNPALELRPGESVIFVVVDPDNRVEESDETNNKASRSLSGMVSESEQVARVGAVRKLDLSGDDLFQVEAQASEGFHFPYYLFIPSGIDKDSPAHLLVETNNSGMVSDDPDVHRAKALTLVKTSHANRMAKRLGVPLLVPTFPRPRPETHNWAYTHELDIDTLEIKGGELQRIDLQLTAMIQQAQKLLRTNGFKVHEKVFLHGFSASSHFCNRYCYLHPDMVKAAAAGGVNGLPTLPVREWNGYELPFPIGLAGIERFTGKPFDEKAFRQVAQYIYMGSADRNDTLLSREAWREEEAAIIRKALAAEKMMPDRWEVSRSIYRQQQLPAQLVTYDGVGHSIQSEMLEDVIKFFQANAGEKYVPIEPSTVRR